jgi:hypothetical protein
MTEEWQRKGRDLPGRGREARWTQREGWRWESRRRGDRSEALWADPEEGAEPGRGGGIRLEKNEVKLRGLEEETTAPPVKSSKRTIMQGRRRRPKSLGECYCSAEGVWSVKKDRPQIHGIGVVIN